MIKRSTAIKLAIQALEEKRQKSAPEARMLLDLGIRSVSTEKAAAIYQRLSEAIEWIKKM